MVSVYRLASLQVLGGFAVSLALGHCGLAQSESTVTLFDGTSLVAWQAYRGPELPGGWVISNRTLFAKRQAAT